MGEVWSRWESKLMKTVILADARRLSPSRAIRLLHETNESQNVIPLQERHSQIVLSVVLIHYTSHFIYLAQNIWNTTDHQVALTKSPSKAAKDSFTWNSLYSAMILLTSPSRFQRRTREVDKNAKSIWLTVWPTITTTTIQGILISQPLSGFEREDCTQWQNRAALYIKKSVLVSWVSQFDPCL